ncbi:MAG: AmmeMemoRadiSam system protein B [Desulfuromonadaceae bacterium]|nr:AmmeMemoRadiSam system protein B [Desulfuromonadaceae bacterium]
MLRAPVVAGQFYPADKDELLRQLENFYAAADSAKKSPARAVLAPHAGYVYSGAVAARALAGVDIPSTVIMLGPNHQGLGSRAAVYDSGAWQTPLGEVAVNAQLATQLCHAVPGFSPDPGAHRAEHSLEVMLPFLQYQNPGVQIVPIMLREHSFTELEQMGQMMAEVLAPLREDVLLLASSDMSHYEPAAVAKQRDLPVLDLLVQGKAQQMYTHVLTHQISMCGIFPATLMLTTLNALDGKAYTGKLLEYTNSAVASGDFASVVGYAAAVFR